MIITSDIIQFELPEPLACPKPTELRNISRDAVRLLISSGNGQIEQAKFKNLPDYLNEGDVLVVNTSATQASAFPVLLPNQRQGVVHFSTPISNNNWLVEIREIVGDTTVRWREGHNNQVFQLPGKASITLKSKFYQDRELLHLWSVEFTANENFQQYAKVHGRPIKYQNLNNGYPLDYYQTFFSDRPGSAEMPSAGRGFTQSLVNNLLAKGIVFAPILLHTGISSLEEHESPYPEYFEIDAVSASALNYAKGKGHRIIAVGTTSVRAVESATNRRGVVVPFRGHTNMYIKSNDPMKTINGLVTGFHEPRASHLHMLQSLAGREHIQRAYQYAIKEEYYWHQFGDLHLILP